MTLAELARSIEARVTEAEKPRAAGYTMGLGGTRGQTQWIAPDAQSVAASVPRAPDPSSVYAPPGQQNAPDLPGRGISQWLVTWEGRRYWWAPDAIPAGNRWSQAILPESVARSLGGVRLTLPEVSMGGVAAAAGRTTWGGAGVPRFQIERAPGWLFSGDPRSHLARQFVPGRGTSDARSFVTEFALPVATIALPAVLGAVLAPVAAGAQGLQAAAASGGLSAGLGTGGGLGLSTGAAGANAAAILGSATAAAPAGLPGLGLSLASASGQAAAAGFSVAGLSTAAQQAAAPAAALPPAPTTPPPLDPFAVPAAGAATPAAAAPANAGGILGQARAGLAAVQAQLAPIQQAAGLASTAASLPAALGLTGGVPAAPDPGPSIDAGVIDRALRAPPVTVTGRFDWTFWLALAAASAVLWRL